MIMRTTAAEDEPLQVVRHVDVSRYLGKWYEIATIPQRFQKGCVGVSAKYSLRKNGDIRVINSCIQGSLDGEVRTVRGKARVVDKNTNAKLKVTFFWPFWGAYWIIGLADDYDWAVVGHPSRDYLWILSRTPHMDDVLYQELLDLVVAKGYDTARLRKTPQPPTEQSLG